MGGTDTTTGATVVSATVGGMDVGYGGPPCLPQLAGQVPSPAPLSDWDVSGYDTVALGEVQMSDRNQYTISISVDPSGDITWQGTN